MVSGANVDWVGVTANSIGLRYDCVQYLLLINLAGSVMCETQIYRMHGFGLKESVLCEDKSLL